MPAKISGVESPLRKMIVTLKNFSMAIFRSFLLGDVKKSVANLTMYIAKGVNIVRSGPLNVHNPRTSYLQLAAG